MTDSEFSIDVKKFKLAETVVADLFQKEYKTKTLSFNNDNKHDFKCLYNNRILNVEVKGDKWCYPDKVVHYKNFGSVLEKGRDSGNIFIEKECRGKLSGINTTKSDYYAYYYVYFKEIWIIRTSELKKLITNNNFEVKKDNVGDKDSDTMGYVIPREDFREHFKIHKIDFDWPY